MKTKTIRFWTITALTASLFAAPLAYSGSEHFSASLAGENEVPPINTAGSAAFQMEIGDTITFSLTFSGLSSPLAVAHLHFAPTKVAGGVMIFLCGGEGQVDLRGRSHLALQQSSAVLTLQRNTASIA